MVYKTCGVVDLRSSDVVPPLRLNFTLQLSGCVRFCCLDGRSIICLVNLSSSGGTTSLDRRSTTPHVTKNIFNKDIEYIIQIGCLFRLKTVVVPINYSLNTILRNDFLDPRPTYTYIVYKDNR